MIYLIVLHFRTVINLTLSNKKRPMSDNCHIYPDILQILITVKKWKLIRYEITTHKGITLCIYLKITGLCQTSEQDEASFKCWRSESLWGSGMPLQKINFQSWRLRNALLSIFHGFFLQKVNLGLKSRQGLILPHANYDPG